MAQVSRPYQIALAVLALFAAVWFLALHRPGSSSQSSGSSAGPASPSSSAAAPSSSSSSSSSSPHAATAGGGGAPGASTPVYHGAAPGVEGLSRAIDRAHGAVAESEQNAKQLAQKSAQASESTPSSTGSAVAGSAAATGSADANNAAAAAAHGGSSSTTKTGSSGAAPRTGKSAPSRPSATAAANAQAAVLQAELEHGQLVLLLFWNPKSTDDASVRREAQAVAAHSKGKLALHVALASQVGQYSSVTRGVQVNQTPTLLLVDQKGLAVTMTGLMDQYAIEQGIREAKQGTSSGS